MPDDTKKTKPQDSSKINIHQPYEVNYWTEELNVSKTKLIEAVGSVGVMVDDVKKHLKSS
jgi:CRISPR/Cas system-associated endonuclease Cas3-HD